MKKLVALLLAAILLVSMTACENKNQETEDTVTIYLPKSEEYIYGDGSANSVFTYTYEDGWQEKDTFTITGEGTVFGAHQKIVMTVSDKKIVSTVNYDSTTQTNEAYYDENGRVIKMIMPIETLDAENNRITTTLETVYTYDDRGRVVKEERTSKTDDGQQPSTVTVNYTYTDTAEGSEGIADGDDSGYYDDPLAVQPMRLVRVYNKDNLLVKEITLMGEQEMSRTEYTYNAHGMQISAAVYSYGQLNYTMKTTLEAVEVSPEKAQQLTAFKSKK